MRNEYFGKFQSDFKGCTLFIGVRNSWPSGHVVRSNQTGEILRYEGFNIDLINAVAQSLNLTPLYEADTPELQNASIGRIKTASMGIQALKENSFFIAQPHTFIAQQFLVPPGEPYTSFEKLFMAFEGKVWILIILTFFIAFVTIFAVNFSSKRVQVIVFGSQVNSPSLNVIIAFFGLSQTITPRRSFARVLLMIFILYSLIIRTAYQGSSFEMLQKDLRRKEIQTVDELVEKNYPIYAKKLIFSGWKGAEILKRFLNYC